MPDRITLDDLRSRHKREERRLILGRLERCGWSVSAAARDLGVATSSLQHLIRRHDLTDLYAERCPPRGPKPSKSREKKNRHGE